jgi:O-antigen/teichoic acid export membrane protein
VTSRSTGFRGLLRSGAGIAVAMAVMNVCTYGFTMLAARFLGPQAYGALAGLMATLLVISVLQLGLQATAARRISADPNQVSQIEAIILRVTYRAALALGALLLILSPLINVVLRLHSLPTAALVAVAAVPLTVMGGQAGILQGERRWRPLAIVYIAAGVPRILIGVALIRWSPTEMNAMLGVTIGAFAPVLVGWWALRRPRPDARLDEQHAARHVIREAIHNSQALFAFFALSNVDVIVARNVLDGHDAGLYAGGLILVKAVLFLPQFVVVVAFPAMSTAIERRHALTRSLALVAMLGVVSTLGAWLLPDVALIFVGGGDYQDIAGRLWLFAVVGTLLSMLQLLVYAVLARQGQRSVYLVWLALVVLVGVGYTLSSLWALLAVVLVVDALLFAILTTVSLYLVAESAPDNVTADQ